MGRIIFHFAALRILHPERYSLAKSLGQIFCQQSETARAAAWGDAVPHHFIEEEREEVPILVLPWVETRSCALCASSMTRVWIPRGTENAILEIQKWNFTSIFGLVSGFSMTCSAQTIHRRSNNNGYFFGRQPGLGQMRSSRTEDFLYGPSKKIQKPPQAKEFGS